MRTIYMKRSLLIILISTSSLISIVYMVDYYLFQSTAEVPEPLLHKGTLNSSISKGTQVIVKSKFSDELLAGSSTPFTSSPNPKCSVTLVLILCEDDEYLSLHSHFTNESSPAGVSRKASRRKKKQYEVPIAKDFSRQINQTLVLLKSVAIQTLFGTDIPPSMRNCVSIVILSDRKSHFDTLKDTIDREWSEEFKSTINLIHSTVKYPKGSEWMRKMFRPCATLRLFIPEILALNKKGGDEYEDSIVVYVDTDFIFLRSVQSLLLKYFSREKNSGDKIVGGMAPCLFHYGTSANKVPYFGSSGLNAGLMLMNLTRMRETLWTNKIRMVTAMFQHSIKLADQDILNIYFHFFPEELQLLSCDWNFRPFQCREGSYCEDSSLAGGISALHGNALSFTSKGPEVLFHTVFQVFHELRMAVDFSLESFVEHLETKVLEAEEGTKVHSDCIQYGGFSTMVLNRFDAMLRSLEVQQQQPSVEIITEESFTNILEELL